MEDEVLERKKAPKGVTGGVWTEDSGVPPPMDPESGPAKPKKPVKKASGGTASSRADGCAVRGKTRGTIIK